jgi:hypothetical protein
MHKDGDANEQQPQQQHVLTILLGLKSYEEFCLDKYEAMAILDSHII